MKSVPLTPVRAAAPTSAAWLVPCGTTTLAPEYKAGTTLTYNGSTNGYVHHSLNGESMNALVLRTSTYADFANSVMPTGTVDVTGVATRFNDTWQILLRTESDVKKLLGNE